MILNPVSNFKSMLASCSTAGFIVTKSMDMDGETSKTQENKNNINFIVSTNHCTSERDDDHALAAAPPAGGFLCAGACAWAGR